MQQDLWIGSADPHEQFGCQEGSQGDRKSDGNPPRRHIQHVQRVLLGKFDMPQNCLGVPVQHATGFGKEDAFRAARDQLPTHLGFQAGEMVADRGLRDVQLIRGARQAAGLDDADEITKLAQVHGRPLLLALCAAARRAVDEFARLAEAYQPGAHCTRFPCIDKADDRNVIGTIRPAALAPAQRRCAIAGACCAAVARRPSRHCAGAVRRAGLAGNKTHSLRDRRGGRRLDRYRATDAVEFSFRVPWRAGRGGEPARCRRQRRRRRRGAGGTRWTYASRDRVEPGRQSDAVAKSRLRLRARSGAGVDGG